MIGSVSRFGADARSERDPPASNKSNWDFAINRILLGLLGIRPGLTPLAAAGLVIIMIGATALTLAVGILAGFIAYRGWHHNLSFRKAGRPLKLAS